MIIYPAIDIRDGRCVRLKQGRYDDMTVYSDDPIETARKFQEGGAKYIHVVDLDGARGDGSNKELIGEIARALNIPIQTGGGIRTMEDVHSILKLGVERVILGTAAVKNPDFVKRAVNEFGNRIVVGIDAKDGYAAIEGWEKVSSLKAVEFAQHMESIGVKNIIYTDIATDGMLGGPNIKAMRKMVVNLSLGVIASGGVSSINDLIALKETGAQGAIVGKAIYTGAVTLKEAIEHIED